MVPAETAKTKWARQGFSHRGAPDTGTSFAKGQTRRVIDPQVTFGMDDEVFEDGKTTRYSLGPTGIAQSELCSREGKCRASPSLKPVRWVR